MTVKELFLNCDRAELKRLFMDIEDVYADEETVDRIFSVIEEKTASASEDKIIFGTEFTDITDGLPSRIDVSAYKISEIRKNFRFCTVNDENSITADEYKALNEFFGSIERCSVDLEEWSSILGFRVDEDNAKLLGKERFMAEILWSMTYYGYSEADIERKRREYSSFRTEENEQGENGLSFDNMASLLFGGDLSFPSEEEEQISLENAVNMLGSYKVISAFYNKEKNNID